MSETHVSIREAAKRLNVSRQRVWQYVNEGRLTVTRSADFPRYALVTADSLATFRKSENGIHLKPA